jgi:8-oxo-dGTP pyrophosphatase MutT (NUDIX family)
MEGESIGAAANRELSEESGLIGENCDVIGYYYTSNRYTDQKQHVVLCTKLSPRPAESDPEEFIESHWKSPDEIKAMSANGEFHNVYMLAALSIYFAQADELVPPA